MNLTTYSEAREQYGVFNFAFPILDTLRSDFILHYDQFIIPGT